MKDKKCMLCGFLTNHKTSLDNHIRHKHTKETPYKCQVNNCGSSFAESSNLKRHQLVHTKEKPYKCNFCDYSATQLCILKNHERTHEGHEGSRPFKCSQCDYAAARKESLTAHEKKVHQQE